MPAEVKDASTEVSRAEEGKNRPNAVLQERFNRGIFQGVRNNSLAPLKNTA